MRQIVHKQRQIVQDDLLKSRLSAIAGGRASASAWRGEAAWYEWSLKWAIGYLLPTDKPIEAMCRAGIVNKIMPGEMLIVNRSGNDTFAISLASESNIASDLHLAEPIAVTGHIHLNTSANIFINTPSRAMAIVKLNCHEHQRLSTLSLLVANAAASTLTSRELQKGVDSGLTYYLEKALYASLAEILCECDPLGMPQFAAMADTRIAKALLAMALAPERAWQIASLAKEAALSRTLFATRFKLLLGITPLEYLTRLRLQLAATLAAENSTLTLHKIANAVGYKDESSLRRARSRFSVTDEIDPH